MNRLYSCGQRYFSSSSACNQNKHVEYCRNLVKSRDYENFLCSILLRGLAQNVAFTVRAFNIEVAQIQESTTQRETAKMRIEFWRNHIQRTYQGRPPNHPVAISLALCLEQQWISEKWFQRVVDIREKYLNNIAFMTLDDAEDYGEYTVSSLFYLILESSQVNNNDLYYAASHLGIASSLVTMIRSTPYHIQKGIVHLPTELCMKHKISQEQILRDQNKSAFSELIFDIASQASLHIDAMKKLLRNNTMSRDVKNVYLPYVGLEQFLQHLQKLDFDVLHSALNRRKWSFPLQIYLTSKRKIVT